MPFVNELIPDEDKRRHALESLKQPPVYKQSVNLRDWTVDRDRGIYMVVTKQLSREDYHGVDLVLGYKGHQIKAYLDRHSEGQFGTHLTTTWSSRSIDIPPALELERTAILAALREALTAYRYLGYFGVATSAGSHEAKFNF